MTQADISITPSLHLAVNIGHVFYRQTREARLVQDSICVHPRASGFENYAF